MNPTFIRILYGDGEGWPLASFCRDRERRQARQVRILRKKIEYSFKNDIDNFLRDKVQYVTMGEWATSTLKSYDVKNITQVDDRPSCHPEGYFHFWHKVYLSHKAMELFGEIICTDFDCVPTDTFSENFEEVLESMEGKVYQSPITNYPWPLYAWKETKGKGWDEISPHIGLCGCFMLIRDINIMKDVFIDWKELIEKYPNKPIASDQVITYSLEKKYKTKTVLHLYDAYDTEACVIERSPIHSLGVTKNKAIFQHR